MDDTGKDDGILVDRLTKVDKNQSIIRTFAALFLFNSIKTIMRTKDWKAINTPKILVIGEDSNLQWSETVAKYVMFADYYFRKFPEDHGERSRNVESRNLFEYVMKLTAHQLTPEDVYITNLCNDDVEPAPKGKRTYIPEEKAEKGIEHIKWILSENPTIKCVLAMSLQTNYWLQKLGFYEGDADFLRAAEPRRVGKESLSPFYQPVDGKAFIGICGKEYEAKEFPVKVFPVLPAKDYPLSEQNMERYAKGLEQVVKYFKTNKLF